MIVLYSGTPGSGKSLHAAKVLLASNNSKKLCVTNFDVDRNKIKNNEFLHVLSNKDLTSPNILYKISNDYFDGRKHKESQINLFIDEAQLLFNSRSYNAKNRMEWLSFFSQHRKYGYDVILMAQFDRMLDRQLRALIEYEVIHRKVVNFGLFGKILSVFFLGKLFLAVRVWYPLKKDIGHEFFVAEKKYYSIYDTFATFEKSTA